MHSPVEVVNLKDLEKIPQLMAGFAENIKKNEKFAVVSNPTAAGFGHYPNQLQENAQRVILGVVFNFDCSIHRDHLGPAPVDKS